MKDTVKIVRCVNPRWTGVSDGSCYLYQSSKVQTMPQGMTHFYDSMPTTIAKEVRKGLMEKCGHTMYYLYQNGTYPIPPEALEAMKKVCRDSGWTKRLRFDGYVRERVW